MLSKNINGSSVILSPAEQDVIRKVLSSNSINDLSKLTTIALGSLAQASEHNQSIRAHVPRDAVYKELYRTMVAQRHAETDSEDDLPARTMVAKRPFCSTAPNAA